MDKLNFGTIKSFSPVVDVSVALSIPRGGSLLKRSLNFLDAIGLGSAKKGIVSFLRRISAKFVEGLEENTKSKSKKKSKSSKKSKKSKKESSSKTPLSKSRVSSTVLSSAPTTSSNSRVMNELKAFLKSPPAGMRVTVGSDLTLWIIHLTFPEGSAYPNETYKLRVKFPKSYPSDPPSVYFLKPTPAHEHVYTNGDICLSLLGSDWRPTLSAEALALSVMSMLTSAKEKSRPQDNAQHAGAKPGGRQDNWVYHDDSC